MSKPQLFLLHFAGGNCYSFHFMMSFLTDFEVVPLELPGRGRRAKEKLLRDFDLAAEDLFNQLTKKLTASNFLIYGHSMGAYLGLKVCSMLEHNKVFPEYLIVSGNAGPGVSDLTKRYQLQHNEFMAELEYLGGMQQDFLSNKDLVDYFIPVLRADFEIVEENNITSDLIVNTPLYAMMGSQEKFAGEILNWSRFTKKKFDAELMEGNHFFIHQHPERVATIIKECYKKTTLLQQS